MSNRFSIGGLIVVASVAGGWWYWHHHHQPESPTQDKLAARAERAGGPGDRRGGRNGGRPVPVLVAEIGKKDLRVVQTAVGTVVPPAVVTVRSRVNGQLVRVLFKEGQTVQAGQVLAEIDPRPFQAQLDQALGQAVRNQALLRNSQIDLERYKTLQSQDSIATQQVDAQASLVQQYQGTVQADQGVVDNARLQLSFTRIVSPIAGRIGLRQVDVGNNITTTDALAVVNAVNPIDVLFTLPEDRVSDLVRQWQQSRKGGRGLAVEAWDRGNTRLLAKGTLQSLDNQIDSTSGTLKLKAQFANSDGLLFPNQFVNVRLLSATLEDATVVPQAAIQYGSNGAYVYRLVKAERLDREVKDGAEQAGERRREKHAERGDHSAERGAAKAWDRGSEKGPGKNSGPGGDRKSGQRGGGKVEVQPIVTGVTEGELVQVSEGLKPGDRVVVSGIDKLRDGARVQVASADGKRERGSGKAGREGRKDEGAREGEGGNQPREGGRRSRDERPAVAGDAPATVDSAAGSQAQRSDTVKQSAAPVLVPVGTFMN